ncbi:MAG: ABC transporter permease [Rhodospirillaceae bacterium]|nr:ABC transporter permease [Rhodospirillaceae bacterium]MBT4589048.1 ABC transporter permease [Rhodospirillaceae bacterium]MBT4938948.1 ABC transporter permease [Rhodospirillaceae bacterium]MBT5940933.1 ABC transporter permease [Rhodospirillaceae bacterium]MBT7265693.1 ABC transporter permease [Rhodospirillaceae bacterium]
MLSKNSLNRFLAFWRHFAAADAINLTLIIIGIFLVWMLISSTIDNPARYLPSPLVVALSSVDMIYKGLLPSYFGDTIMRLIVGSSIGLALGIPFGLLLGLNRTIADMFYPMMNFFQSVSGIAIFPIVVVWWGNSDETVLAVILYTSFFPIAFTVLSGVREVPIRYISAARTLGATRYQIIRDVLLPGSMPHIATGSRLSIGFAWRAVIAGEMLAGREGLGWMIFTGQDADKTSEVILGMVLIGVSWIILDHYLLRPLEADTIERWGLVQR